MINNNTMVYLNNLQKFCIIKVQGGERIFRSNKNCVVLNNLHKPNNKPDTVKVTPSWLYESYLRDRK